uniref:RBR-type E3 ubiquitin transferase n=1 Tax=Globodera rostochiensis TaxID=31243 RepID=A0A914H3W7_GLORO
MHSKWLIFVLILRFGFSEGIGKIRGIGHNQANENAINWAHFINKSIRRFHPSRYSSSNSLFYETNFQPKMPIASKSCQELKHFNKGYGPAGRITLSPKTGHILWHSAIEKDQRNEAVFIRKVIKRYACRFKFYSLIAPASHPFKYRPLSTLLRLKLQDEYQQGDEVAMEEVTNAGTSSSAALSSEEIKDYQILSQTELIDELSRLSTETAAVLGFKGSICKSLLHHYKWNKVTLIERFYETSDTDAFFRSANLLDPTKHSRIEGKTDFCKICYERRPLSGLFCNHLFCGQCWSNYLSSKILDEGRPYITCPELRCTVVADDDFVLKTVKSPQALRSYNRLILNSFVECNTLIKWCPAPECGRAVKVPHAEPRKVSCKCGFMFCFGCSQQWHEPIGCEKLKTWLKKCSDDSETSNWLNANTKDCPQCQVTIEKDGGCNHMTCKNLACKFEFCWMCLGPWAPHGSGWYSCNRYDDDAARRARDAQERSRAALQRYLHYYMRYTNHQNSLKLERKLFEKVSEKMEQMQMLGFSWIETQFLQKAVEVLIECRRTLMYTYVFAFYLVQNNITKMFEDNQSDLELATEQLSESNKRSKTNIVMWSSVVKLFLSTDTLDNKVEFKRALTDFVKMGNLYAAPKRVGPNPYTRSGAPPPKLVVRKDKDVPIHRVNDPMSLQLHMADERVRTAGLSPAEREWREKWVHDQNMHPDEPVHVDAVHRQLNPVRVLYRWPWDKLYKHFLRPTFGTFYGTLIRLMVPKYCWVFLSIEAIYYIWKYESKSWQKTKEHDKEKIKLGYTDYGRYDYYDRDFYENYKTADIDLGPSKRPW